MPDLSADDRRGLDAAIEEARIRRSRVVFRSARPDDRREIVGRGHNRRVQNGSAILHGETDCLENAGRRSAADYRRATLYTTCRREHVHGRGAALRHPPHRDR